MAFPSDLEIARSALLKPLDDVAHELGIGPHLLEPYGESVVKIKLAAIDELADRPNAKYVVVTAITPTPLGEGKTTTTVGLGQGFRHIGKRATVAIRQPSMGSARGPEPQSRKDSRHRGRRITRHGDANRAGNIPAGNSQANYRNRRGRRHTALAH